MSQWMYWLSWVQSLNAAQNSWSMNEGLRTIKYISNSWLPTNFTVSVILWNLRTLFDVSDFDHVISQVLDWNAFTLDSCHFWQCQIFGETCGNHPERSSKKSKRPPTPEPVEPTSKRIKIKGFIHPDDVLKDPSPVASDSDEEAPEPVMDVSSLTFTLSSTCMLGELAVIKDTDFVPGVLRHPNLCQPHSSTIDSGLHSLRFSWSLGR